jgi:hypothetical protein
MAPFSDVHNPPTWQEVPTKKTGWYRRIAGEALLTEMERYYLGRT